MFFRNSCAVLIAVLLAGCGSEDSARTDFPEVLSGSVIQVTQLIKKRRTGLPPKIELTAQQLAQNDKPVLQINPEVFGGSDFLGRVTSRNDSALGVVDVWKSANDVQLILRNGVVVGTRGVGGDIISANADVTIRALRARANSSGVRTYIISDGDVTTTKYQFRCTVTPVGPQDITIANQLFKTVYMRERCVGGPSGNAVLNNEYWVQNSTALVRKSRQWLGPRIGYFEILLARN